MKNRFFKFYFVILIISVFFSGIIYSSCQPTHGEIEVPAVVSESNGGLVTLEFDIEPGKGDIYIQIPPPVGISTQNSIENSLDAAASFTGFDYSECDYRIGIIGASGSRYIDGPSAGLAMGLEFASLFSGKKLNDNVIVTGTLSQSGKVGKIGGLIEKVMASSRNGKKVLLTKLSGTKDYIIANNLMDKYDIKIINVDTLSDAFYIATSNLSNESLSKYSKIESIIEPTEIVDDYEYHIPRFDNMSYEIVDMFNSEAENYYNQLSDGSHEKEIVKDMLDDVDNQKKLINRGYSYTAANNIFNRLLDLKFIETIDAGPINLSQKISEAKECLNNFELYEKRTDNWEWITGSEVRIDWAKNKIKDIDVNLYENNVEEAKFDPLYNILNAEEWCYVSKLISFKGKGQLIDESKLSDLVSVKSQETKQYILRFPEASTDTVNYITMADEAAKNKHYLVALYDYAFAYGVQKSYVDTFDKSPIQVKAMLNGIEDVRYNHTWPNIYHSQAVYLYKTKDYESSYRIKCIADKMEEYFDDAEHELMEKGNGGNKTVNVNPKYHNSSSGSCREEINKMKIYITILIVIIVLEFVLIVSMMFNTKI